MARKIKEFKRCPRCDTKALIYQDKCPACGLVYSRLINASNKEAKKALKRGEKHKVITDKTLPSDVSKWKLFFLALFLGMFGGHYYYIGKTKTAVAFTVSTALLMIGAALIQNDSSLWVEYYFWMWFFILPASCCLIVLAIDLVKILCNSFRVPIALKEAVVVSDVNATEETNKQVLKIVEEVNEKVAKEIKETEKSTEEPKEVKQEQKNQKPQNKNNKSSSKKKNKKKGK